jgi:hypothetical protein
MKVRRRLLAELRNLRLLWREMRWSLIFVVAAWIVGVFALHHGYPRVAGEEAMEWDRSIYYTLAMMFFGHVLDYREAAPWWVKTVFFALPLLGLFVVIDTVVRLNGFLFRRRFNRKEWQEMLASTFSNHIVVCGLGHVGYRIVEDLVRRGEQCVAIEPAESEFLDEAAGLDVPVIVGPAQKREVLEKARVSEAKCIVAATDIDMINIDIALTARELAPQIRTVLRLFDHRLVQKFEKLRAFDHVFSASALAAPFFAAAASEGREPTGEMSKASALH